jgi:hypothetical protein
VSALALVAPGLLSGTPTAGTAGSYPIQITATTNVDNATRAVTLAAPAILGPVTVMPVHAGGGTSLGWAVWAVDSTGVLWNGWQPSAGSAWSWAQLGSGFDPYLTPAVEPVDAGGATSGGFAVWVTDTSGNLWNGWQTSPGSAWKWANLGGGNLNAQGIAVEPVDAGGGHTGGFAVWLVNSLNWLVNGWQTAAGSGWKWAALSTSIIMQGTTPTVVPVDAGGGTTGGFAVWDIEWNGDLWNLWQTAAGSGWRWADMGGGNVGTQVIAVEPVDAGGATTGGFALWLVDGSGHLQNGSQTAAGSGWKWAELDSGNTYAGTPTVVPVEAGGATTGGFAVWADDSNSDLRYGLQTSTGSAWTFTTIYSPLGLSPVAEPAEAGGSTSTGFTVWVTVNTGALENGLQLLSPNSAWTWTNISAP